MAKDNMAKDKKYPEKFEDSDLDCDLDCNRNCRHCVDEDICDETDEYYDFGIDSEDDLDDFDCFDDCIDPDDDYERSGDEDYFSDDEPGL